MAPVLPSIQYSVSTDWYWKADDGRIYGLKRNALLYPYDLAYLAFVAAMGSATPWPKDGNGNQTTAALQAIVSQYGITLLFT